MITASLKSQIKKQRRLRGGRTDVSAEPDERLVVLLCERLLALAGPHRHGAAALGGRRACPLHRAAARRGPLEHRRAQELQVRVLVAAPQLPKKKHVGVSDRHERRSSVSVTLVTYVRGADPRPAPRPLTRSATAPCSPRSWCSASCGRRRGWAWRTGNPRWGPCDDRLRGTHWSRHTDSSPAPLP